MKLAGLARTLGRVAEGFMGYRCDVERGVEVNDGAGSTTLDWQPHLVAMPCLVYEERAGDEQVVGGRMSSTHQRIVTLPVGTDVTVKDRLVNVLDERGELMHAGPLEITSVGRYLSHLELVVAQAS